MENKIKVFVRHCFHSDASKGKSRPEWFSKERALKNLKETIDSSIADYTIIYDSFYGPRGDLLKNEDNVVETSCGEEGKSFLFTLDYVNNLNLDDETIIYFLEDDYIHYPDWCRVMLEGFELNPDMLTLYDHYDKYMPGYYDPPLQAQMFTTKSCHWRTTPNTTNTYALKAKTLRRDIEIHKQFSINRKVSDDFNKFIYLWQQGRSLISCIPGYSTHTDSGFESPIVNWKEIIEQSSNSD